MERIVEPLVNAKFTFQQVQIVSTVLYYHQLLHDLLGLKVFVS